MFRTNKPGLHLLVPILLVPAFWLSSCQNRAERPEHFGSYHLEKEKEFLIHSLTSVELLDYYPPDGLYLGYRLAPGGKEICLVNEDGEILLSRNMQGEGPGQHPSNLSSLGFSETGDIWAMTSVHVLRYDQNLQLLERFTYTPNIMINLYALATKFSHFRIDTNYADIIFPVVPSGVGVHNGPDSYNTSKLLEFYDQRQAIFKEIAPISERRITEEFLNIVKGSYAPVYVLDPVAPKMFLTGTFDNEITIYDLGTDSVTRSFDIYYEDPNAVEPPKPIGSHTLSSNAENWLITPMNKSIHQLDNGLIALEYIMGVSVNPNPPKDVIAEMHPDIYQNRLIMFDQNRQVSRDISIPERGVVMTSLPGNRVLVKTVNTEKEEDYIRYVIYKVVEE